MIDVLKLKEITKDLRVLCVDDNDELREVIVEYLQKLFKSVDDYSNGEEGLKAYNKSKHDIVLTDINMPIMNGLTMSKNIKEKNPSQHIIIISAYKEIENYISSIKIGVDGYILKPMDFNQVNAIIYKIALQIAQAKQNETYKNNLEALVEQKTKELKSYYITDQLTGLYNKQAIKEKLAQKQLKTIVLLNIDNFTILNNNFGFLFGDKVIHQIAIILKEFQKGQFKLYRLQGDEFVFLSETEALEAGMSLAKEIQKYFNENKIYQDSIPLHITFSYGIDQSDTRDLLLSSSLAIQEYRQNNTKNLIGVYHPNSLYEQSQKYNLHWVDKIRECMKNDRIEVMFQPIKNIKEDKIEKFEALSRVITQDGQTIMPDDFIKALVLSGFITKFTKIVITKALQEISGTQYSVSVNITNEDLKENYLLAYLDEKCKQFNIKKEQVILEVLETVSSVNETKSLKQLQVLKAQGYKIAIDDFGTEHSNFGRLLTLDVDIIKIDGSFIKNIVTNNNAQEIVKSIILFAHNIGKRVIAEYVFSKEIYERVKELNIDFAQGYYIDEPRGSIKEVLGE